LEDLKVCADKHIFIQRSADGLSLIQYGDVEVAITAAAEGLKKRGRPTKPTKLKAKMG
jgi:hypothetical protein